MPPRVGFPATYADEAKEQAEEEQKEAIEREERRQIWLKTIDQEKESDQTLNEEDFEREERRRRRRARKKKLGMKHQLAHEVKDILMDLFKEIKRFLNNEGGLTSLFQVYVLFDELFVVFSPLILAFITRAS